VGGVTVGCMFSFAFLSPFVHFVAANFNFECLEYFNWWDNHWFLL